MTVDAPLAPFAKASCPVCETSHERGPSAWIGPHLCPSLDAPADFPWCSTCQTGCARRVPTERGNRAVRA